MCLLGLLKRVLDGYGVKKFPSLYFALSQSFSAGVRCDFLALAAKPKIGLPESMGLEAR